LNGWEHDHLGDLDRNLARVPNEWTGLDAADKHRLRLARAALWANAGGSLSRVALVTPSMPDDVIDRTIVEWLQKVVFGRQCKTGLQMANALATFIEAKKAVMRDPAWITELIEGAA
jgi:hypothetical protein